MPDGSHTSSGTLEQDLDRLGGILEENVPAYVLVRLDDPPTEWLAIYYVPDSAKVRDKVRVRSSRMRPVTHIPRTEDAVCRYAQHLDQEPGFDALYG